MSIGMRLHNFIVLLVLADLNQKIKQRFKNIDCGSRHGETGQKT